MIVLFLKFAKINVKIFHVYEWEWSPSKMGSSCSKNLSDHTHGCAWMHTDAQASLGCSAPSHPVVKLVSILAQG